MNKLYLETYEEERRKTLAHSIVQIVVPHIEIITPKFDRKKTPEPSTFIIYLMNLIKHNNYKHPNNVCLFCNHKSSLK